MQDTGCRDIKALQVTMNKKMILKTDELWKDYINKNFDKYLTSLKDEEFVHGRREKISASEIASLDPKMAYDLLRKKITQVAITKLQNRFRAFKHREKRDVKNIQLKSHYLHLLSQFKDLVGAGTLEEALDFLLSPDYRDYKSDVSHSIDELANGSFETDDAMAEYFACRLKNYDRERLLLIIEQAFYEGWTCAKKSKKRSGNPRKERLHDFELYNSVLKQIAKN